MFSVNAQSMFVANGINNMTQHNNRMLDHMMSDPGSTMNRSKRAAMPGARLVVAFGMTEDAVAIFKHDDYWQTPGTLPDELEGMFRSGTIPLNTIRVVAIGPNGSFFVVSGIQMWWNLKGMNPIDSAGFERTMREIAGNDFYKAVDGKKGGGVYDIHTFSFGVAGDAVMPHGSGLRMLHSDHPGPDPASIDAMNSAFQSNSSIGDYSIGPYGTAMVRTNGSPLPFFWSKHLPGWPSEDLQREITTAMGAEFPPIVKIQLSTACPKWHYIVRVDPVTKTIKFKYKLPSEAEAKIKEWIPTMGPLDFY